MKSQVIESNEIQTKSESKPVGGFIKTFGKIFQEFGSQGKEVVQQKMLELFPDKEQTILTWTDWYKAYYNMGKISGFESPAKVSWKMSKTA